LAAQIPLSNTSNHDRAIEPAPNTPPLTEEEQILKRLGPVALSQSRKAATPKSAPPPPVADKPRRWVQTAALPGPDQADQRDGPGRRLVRKLSALAGFKPRRSFDSEPDCRRPTAMGGRQDSWGERLSSDTMAHSLGFLASAKDSVTRGVAQRDELRRAEGDGGEGSTSALETAGPSPPARGGAAPGARAVNSMVQVARRLSARWSS
jgi:hypothetical protein